MIDVPDVGITVTAKHLTKQLISQQLVEEGWSDAAIQTLNSDYLKSVLLSLRSSLCTVKK